jgi:hypothetical protein
MLSTCATECCNASLNVAEPKATHAGLITPNEFSQRLKAQAISISKPMQSLQLHRSYYHSSAGEAVLPALEFHQSGFRGRQACDIGHQRA